MYQPSPQKWILRAEHHCEWWNTKSVDKFTYLGSTLARNVRINEVAHRIAKVSAAFGKLSDNVWKRKGLSVKIAKGLQGCCLALFAILLWDLDCIQPTCYSQFWDRIPPIGHIRTHQPRNWSDVMVIIHWMNDLYIWRSQGDEGCSSSAYMSTWFIHAQLC